VAEQAHSGTYYTVDITALIFGREARGGTCSLHLVTQGEFL
jgi:hypothetical protein